MIVDQFNLLPIKGSEAFQLIINNKRISDRISYLELDNDFVQIDVCSHCDYPGCSSTGYVEVLQFNDVILWKEPLKPSNFQAYYSDYDPAIGLKYGTIFWGEQDFQVLVANLNKKLNGMRQNTFKEINCIQGYDLWRIYASKCFQPEYRDSFGLEHIEDRLLGMYAVDISEQECITIYNDVKNRFKNCNINKLMQAGKVSDQWIKLTMMFDTPNYQEWDCIYLDNDRVWYSIGDKYGVSIS